MSNSGGRIYTDENTGVSIGDLQVVLGTARNDLGGIITNAEINENSLHKPVRSNKPFGTEQDIKVPTKYGWTIIKKNIGSNTNTFINTIKTYGASFKYWNYEKPRGSSYNEWFRLLDFNGYNHYAVAYRTPCYLSRLTASDIQIPPISLNIQANSDDYEYVQESDPFTLNDAYDITVIASVYGSSPSINWDIDGSLDVTLLDSNNRVVDHTYETGFGVRNGVPQPMLIHFENFHSLEGYDGPFRIQYRTLFSNHTTHEEGGRIYSDSVTVNVDTSYAATLTRSRTGQDGVVIRPSSEASEWRENSYRARSTIFGEFGYFPLAVIEVYNGSTTQRKICLIPSSGFIPFKRIGITIRPREETYSKDIIVYLLYGNYTSIFPEYQTGIDYGALDLANGNVLVAAPNCYNELGIIAEDVPPVEIVQDDCQGATFTYSDSSTETGLLPYPSPRGFTDSEKLLSIINIPWGIIVYNATEEMPISVKLCIYTEEEADSTNEESDLIKQDTETFVVDSSDWSATANLEVALDNLPTHYAPYELYAKIKIEFNGETYYINIGQGSITTTDPGRYKLGEEPA